MSEALIFDPNVQHIAVLLVVISIIISGIAIGLGRAFGYKHRKFWCRRTFTSNS